MRQNHEVNKDPRSESLLGSQGTVFAVRVRIDPLSKLDPMSELTLPHPPLTADFERGQIVFADHPLQRTGGDVQQLRRLRKCEQSKIIRRVFHERLSAPI